MSPCDMLHEPLGGLRNGGPIFSVPWVQQADLNQHLDKIDLVDLDAEPDAACACARSPAALFGGGSRRPSAIAVTALLHRGSGAHAGGSMSWR
jgi:hypothetical protein